MMKKNANFKSKNTLTLKDLKKIRERSDYNISLEEAYEIAAGWKEIKARDPKVRDMIFARAMNMVRNDDPDFAQEIINERKANGNKKLATFMSLASAYDIVGGYRDADSETYYKALELVKLDSPEFAETLSKMRNSGSSLKAMSVDDVKDFSERLEQNVDKALEIYSKGYIEDITDEVLEDKAVVEAFSNTPFVDDNGIELVNDEREKAERLVVQTSALEEIQNVVEATSDKELSKETIVENVKNRTLFNLGVLRIGALRPKTMEFINAIKEKSESFFTNTVGKMREAFNFKKKVSVKQSVIVEKFNKAKTKASSFFNKLKSAVSSSKIKAKLNKLTSTVLATIMIASSCGPINNNQHTETPTPQPKIETITDTTSMSESKMETCDFQNDDTITVPTAWNENMGISQKRWKTLTSSYFQDKEGNNNYTKLYTSITNDMLEQGGVFEGKTREQVLSFYASMSARNLIPHRNAIKALDDFFKNCDGNATISTDSYKDIWSAMKQFKLSTGDLVDLNSEGDQWVESMVIDCGKTTKLNIKKPAPVNVVEEKVDTVTTAKSDTLDVVFETVTHSPETVILEEADTIKVDLFRGNNTNPSEGEFVSTSSASSVLSEKPNKDRKVVVEQSTYKSTVTDTTAVENIEISDTLATQTAKTTIEEATIVVTSNDEITSSSTGTTNASTDTLATSSSSYVEVIDDVEYDVNIVADSDSLAIGTPAADNVPERGGYDNSGLTEAQYNRAVSYFQKDGDGMFYTLVEGVKSHTELRTKGGIAEGLSAEETVYLLMVADLWGGQGQFKEEVAEFINYINDCDKTLDMSEEIKEIFNRGNINASMDGIVGRNANQVLHTDIGDCGENPSQVVKTDSRTVKPSSPVSEKFPEFYRLRNTREFAIVFEEEVHEAKTITTTVEETMPVDIDLMRGNDFVVAEGEVVRENVEVEEVQNLRPNKDRKVVVSTSQTYSNDEVMSRREKRRASRGTSATTPTITYTADR